MTSRTDTRPPKIFDLPAVGALIEIAYDYATEGSVDEFGKMPPWRAWWRTLGWPILLALGLAFLPFPCGCLPNAVKITASPHDLALMLIPSLLGFGIGVYALVFGLNGELLRNIQKEHNNKPQVPGVPAASVLNINSAFAFPLLMMVITVFVASLQKVFPEPQILATFTWFLTFFCLALTYQLVASLYKLGRVIILEKFE